MSRSIDTGTWEMLLQLRNEGGSPVISELCQIFFNSTPRRLGRIREALRGNHPAVVAREAHALKSASANLGALKLSQLCMALEGLAKATLLHPTGASVFGQLEQEFNRVSSEARELLQRLKPPAPPARKETGNAGKNDAKRVLVVDDDPFYLSIITRTVAQVIPESNITTSDNYDRAVELIRQCTSKDPEMAPYSLVISDLSLNSSSTGINLFGICRTSLPSARLLLISGTPLDEFMALVGDTTGEAPAYLPKPFRVYQCRKALEWLLGADQRVAA